MTYDEIKKAIRQAPHVYVHCQATPTAGSYFEVTKAEAMKVVNRLYHYGYDTKGYSAEMSGNGTGLFIGDC